jgi:cytochrome oxidase Cu insertion factor (SCO1/SenC/PrrC family)
MIPHILIKRLFLGLALFGSLGAASLYLHRPPGEPDDNLAECCKVNDSVSIPATETLPPPPEAAAPDTVVLSRPLTIPDTTLVDQRGRAVRFYSDLVKGQTVAINFIFTSCKGACPPLGAKFAALERALEGRGVKLISVSVDPVNDTPGRLADWASRFGAGPDWTLVTGAKQDVDGLLKALGVFSSEKANHSPFVLIGNDRTGAWRRIHGLSPLEKIKFAIGTLHTPEPRGAAEPSPGAEPDSPARRYFTDVPLVNQRGETMRLYSDLLRGKVVVIHVFFASCKNTCPLMMSTFQKLQAHLGDRLGREVSLLSLTVDPENDTQEVLKDYAARVDAHAGWHLLTGPKENVRLALARLGQVVEEREQHSNIFIIGNESTGLWKKVRGLDPAGQIIAVLDGVIADDGGPARPGD